MSLKEEMTTLADVIRRKTGRTEALGIRGMAEAVAEIGGLIGAITITGAEAEQSEEFVALKAPLGSDSTRRLVNGNTQLTLCASLSNFGTARREDVLEGMTFTSAAGFLVSGTYQPLAMDAGTTDCADVVTNLSEISGIVLYRNSGETSGLVCAIYDGSSTLSICSNEGTVEIGADDEYSATAGGTFIWNGAGNAGMREDVLYRYIAWGKA